MNTLIPFFIGALIAYLLNPIIKFFDRKKVNRNISSFLTIVTFFLFIYAFTFLVIPIIAEQTVSFWRSFPVLNQIETQISKISILINSNFLDLNYKEALKNLNEGIGSFLKIVIKKIFFSSIAIVNLLSFIIITPIVAWYFLKDWNRIVLFFIKNIPSKYKKIAKKNLKKVDIILASFFRGQFLVSIILGCYYFIAFF